MNKLPWEYCECGCKGSALSIGSLDFWYFDDLKDTLYLYRGHGHYGSLLKKFKNNTSGYKEKDKIVKEMIKIEIKTLKRVIEKYENIFDVPK